MLISVDNSRKKYSKENSVDKQEVKNIEFTCYPQKSGIPNSLKNNKINRVEKTYNHIHTAYDKY